MVNTPNPRRQCALNHISNMLTALEGLEKYLQEAWPAVHADVTASIEQLKGRLTVFSDAVNESCLKHPGSHFESPLQTLKKPPTEPTG